MLLSRNQLAKAHKKIEKNMDEIRDTEIAKYFLPGNESPLGVARQIILFGKNSATYKFALMKTLLEFSPCSEIQYSEIGQPFLEHLVNHHKICPYQYNRASTQLAKAIDQYLVGQLSWDDLFLVAEKSIYNNVFDAAHNIGGGKIREPSVLFENLKQEKKIVLTDSLNSLQETTENRISLIEETEARWRIVEEAWRAGVSPNLFFDRQEKSFYRKAKNRRINLRSAVPTLMPYQKNECFYCSRPLSQTAKETDEKFAQVEHVLPWSRLQEEFTEPDFLVDGIWNLVLSCKDCNHGPGGKHSRIPDERIFARLYQRNILFSKEHGHLVKTGVLNSLGISVANQMLKKMQQIYRRFDSVGRWSPNV